MTEANLHDVHRFTHNSYHINNHRFVLRTVANFIPLPIRLEDKIFYACSSLGSQYIARQKRGIVFGKQILFVEHHQSIILNWMRA
jgi:hypothetical protein